MILAPTEHVKIMCLLINNYDKVMLASSKKAWEDFFTSQK